VDHLEQPRTDDPNSFETFVTHQNTAEILDEILKRAGPSGLSYNLRNELDLLLKLWTENDYRAAFEWANSQLGVEARKELLTNVLRANFKNDFHASVSDLRHLKTQDGISLPMGAEFITFSSKIGAEAMTEALILSSSNLVDPFADAFEDDPQYPENFDFQKAATLIAAHLRGLPNLSADNIPFLPSNFLSKWSETDADVALDYYLNNQVSPFSSMSEITSNMFDMNTPSEIFPFVRSQLQSLSGEAREKFLRNLPDIFPNNSRTESLVAFAQSAPTPTARQQMALAMIANFGHTRSDQKLEFADLLIVLPTSKQRLEAIRNSNMLPYVDMIPDETLLNLNLTREQVNALKLQ